MKQSKTLNHLTERVMCQQEYLGSIRFFLHLTEIFHYEFMNNDHQSKLTDECIAYNFGKTFAHQWNTHLKFHVNNDNDKTNSDYEQPSESISVQISHFYTNFKHIFRFSQTSI